MNNRTIILSSFCLPIGHKSNIITVNIINSNDNNNYYTLNILLTDSFICVYMIYILCIFIDIEIYDLCMMQIKAVPWSYNCCEE